MRVPLSVLLLSASGLAAQSRLTVIPARPAPGALVELRVAGAPADARAVRGLLAGEPLHFVRASDGSWHAIGGIPVDATGSISARAFVVGASGKADTVRVSMSLPPVPKPKAEPLKVDSSFSKPMDEATADRINAENARARALGAKSHDTPILWSGPFLRPRRSGTRSGRRIAASSCSWTPSIWRGRCSTSITAPGSSPVTST